MPAGAATDVGDLQAAHLAEQLIDPRLLQRDQRIAIAIIKLRPAVVAVAGGKFVDRNGLGLLRSWLTRVVHYRHRLSIGVELPRQWPRGVFLIGIERLAALR